MRETASTILSIAKSSGVISSRLLLPSLIFSSLIVSSQALALSPAGKTMIAKGNVQAYEEANNSRKLKRRAPIFGIDTVETADKSKAQFRMNDGTLLALKENSKLLISEYQYNQEEGGGSAVMELVEGGLRSVTGAIKSNNGTYELKTPVGSIGIRGTHYEIEIIQGDVFLAVWDGAIDMTVQTAPGVESVVSFGEGEDFSFGIVTEEGEITQLLEPPANFNKGHSDDQSEEESSEEGDSEEGDSEEGDSEEGDSEEGDSEEGDSEEGDSEEGESEEGGSEEGNSEEGDSEEGDSEEGDSEEGSSEEGDSEEGGSEEGDSEEGGSEEGGSEEGGSEDGGSEDGGSEDGGSEEGGSEEGGSGDSGENSESGGSESSSGDDGSDSENSGSDSGGSDSGDASSSDGNSSGDNEGSGDTSGGSENSGTDTGTTGGTDSGAAGGADSGAADNSDTGTTTPPAAGSTDPGAGNSETPPTDTGGIGDSDTTPPDLDTSPPTEKPGVGDVEDPFDEANEEQRDQQVIQEINNNTRALPEVIAARTGTASFSRLLDSSLSGTGNPSNLNINMSVNFDTTFTEGDLNINTDNGQWLAFFQGVLVDADFELDFTSVTFGNANLPDGVLTGSGNWGETFLANEADVINGRFSLNQGGNSVSGRFELGEN